MRPRSANEWRDFWRDGGERELAAQLDELEPYSVRIATLLGSAAPMRAIAAELGRIRANELGAPPDPARDEELARRIHDWFGRAGSAAGKAEGARPEDRAAEPRPG